MTKDSSPPLLVYLQVKTDKEVAYNFRGMYIERYQLTGAFWTALGSSCLERHRGPQLASHLKEIGKSLNILTCAPNEFHWDILLGKQLIHVLLLFKKKYKHKKVMCKGML